MELKPISQIRQPSKQKCKKHHNAIVLRHNIFSLASCYRSMNDPPSSSYSDNYLFVAIMIQEECPAPCISMLSAFPWRCL